MKGPDGWMRQHAWVDSAAALVTVIAAPPAGWEIVVFGVQYSANNTVEIILQNGVPTTLWILAPNNGYPVFFPSECLFRTGDNQPLDMNNVSLAGVRMNVQYEIRPTGI